MNLKIKSVTTLEFVQIPFYVFYIDLPKLSLNFIVSKRTRFQSFYFGTSTQPIKNLKN